MKKILITAMVLLGVIVSNAQTQNVKKSPAKPVAGQTPPQSPPGKPATQTTKTTVVGKSKKASPKKKRKIKSKIPSMGIEKIINH